MKRIYVLVIFVIAYFSTYAQIQLPKGFRCVLGENHINESYFTNGKLSFKSYPWGHDGIYGEDVIKTIESTYENHLKFARTKDNLYWASGKHNNEYVYIVIVDGVLQFTLSSTINNSEFSNMSTWMLQQIRNNIASNKDNYFTDYKGTSCSGIK